MSKADEMKRKLDEDKKRKENAAAGLFNQESPIVNINDDVDAIINANRSKKSQNELVGIYFEPAVKEALDRMQKREGRGAKSSFVNDIVKWALSQKGLLK